MKERKYYVDRLLNKGIRAEELCYMSIEELENYYCKTYFVK